MRNLSTSNANTLIDTFYSECISKISEMAKKGQNSIKYKHSLLLHNKFTLGIFSQRLNKDGFKTSELYDFEGSILIQW